MQNSLLYIEQDYEQINKTINTDKDTIKIKLSTENFWILKLDSLTPKALNQELNNV